jgi:flagellar hook-associated protein 1 FlgK
MSFGGLRTGVSGLAASQRALETSAHNVANANTDGYSRQRVDLSTATPILEHRGLFGPGALGQGVSIDGVRRAHDTLVSANHRETLAQSGSWDSRAAFFARAETVLGPLGSGAPQALTDFWNSWENLSQDPESTTSRNLVLDAGRQLAGTLNEAAARIDGVVVDLTHAVSGTTIAVNDLATHVATLNDQIKAARLRGDTPNDLLDQRDLALADLARLAGTRTNIEADGDARVTIGGIALVDGGNSQRIEASGVPPSLTWTVDGGAVFAGGELGSNIELATTVSDSLTADRDRIALELAALVNSTHAAGYGLDGTTGQDFFSATGAGDIGLATGLDARSVAASASGAPADGNHAIAMGGLRTAATGAGVNVGELMHSLQGRLGLEAAHAGRQLEMSQVVLSDIEESIAELSGVSTDEELTDMLQYQRAYEASARVITVIDDMLDKLINGTGVTR